MKRCIYDNEDCDGRVEWEHAWIYSGRQIQEVWAIVPVCTYHHRGKGLNKSLNQYLSLVRAMHLNLFASLTIKYPKVNWIQQYHYLKKKFKNIKIPIYGT